MLRGNRPGIWTVPAYGLPYGKDVCLTIALQLRPAQLFHVERMLVSAGASNFKIPLISLIHVAEPVAGEDLEAFYSWGKPQLSQQQRFKPYKRIDRDAFLDALFAKGVGRTRFEVETWWLHFCNHMLDWLLNNDRPVDLYFAMIWPHILRPNWKDAVLKRCRNAGVEPSLRFRKFSRSPAMQAELRRTPLVAVTHRGTISRSLELETNSEFTAASAKVDALRLRHLGKEDYANLIIALREAFIPHAARIFLRWLAVVRRSSAELVSNGQDRSLSFATISPDSTNVRNLRGRGTRVTPALFPPLHVRRGRPTDRSARALLRLPPLQSPSQKLRNPG